MHVQGSVLVDHGVERDDERQAAGRGHAVLPVPVRVVAVPEVATARVRLLVVDVKLVDVDIRTQNLHGCTDELVGAQKVHDAVIAVVDAEDGTHGVSVILVDDAVARVILPHGQSFDAHLLDVSATEECHLLIVAQAAEALEPWVWSLAPVGRAVALCERHGDTSS